MADGQLDLDLRSYLRALLRWWWLIVTLAAVGAIAAGGATFTQAKTYDATSSVYLGQATDANGNAIASITTNAKAATQIVTSEATLRQVVERVGDGLTVRRLRAQLSVQTPTQTVKGIASPLNFVTITVRDTKPARAAEAANALAEILIEKISTLAERKIAFLKQQIARDDRELAELQARSQTAQAALDAIARSNAPRLDKALAAAPYIGIAQAAAGQRQPLQDDKRLNELMLIVAKEVERPHLLTEAVPPSSPSGPSLTLNAAAGLLVGLVVGIVAAFVLERRRHALA